MKATVASRSATIEARSSTPTSRMLRCLRFRRRSRPCRARSMRSNSRSTRDGCRRCGPLLLLPLRPLSPATPRTLCCTRGSEKPTAAAAFARRRRGHVSGRDRVPPLLVRHDPPRPLSLHRIRRRPERRDLLRRRLLARSRLVGEQGRPPPHRRPDPRLLRHAARTRGAGHRPGRVPPLPGLPRHSTTCARGAWSYGRSSSSSPARNRPAPSAARG